MLKKYRRRFLNTFALIGTLTTSLFLCGCGEPGYSGGLVFGIVHEGVYEKCGDNYGSASVQGKRTTIDGVEITLPVDYTYGKSQQADYNGANWQGDDSVRGIGLFSNEDGDGEGFESTYSVNMRWCYAHFADIIDGEYPTHATYTGVSKSTGITVGGTDKGGSNIVTDGDEDSAEFKLLEKTHVLLYNQDNGKACVCRVGYGEGDSFNPNWGGNPLALEFGVSPLVSSTLEAQSNSTVLEGYFVDVDTPLGEYTGFNGSSATSSTGKANKCFKASSSIDGSSIADLAVSCAFDATNDETANFAGHERIYYKCGSVDHNKDLPSTNLARALRQATCGDEMTADCGMFAASVVRAVADKDFPTGCTKDEITYCQASPNWTEVESLFPEDAVELGILQPGDLLITDFGGDHHATIYTGNEAILKQFGTGVQGGYLTDTSFNFVEANLDLYGPTIRQTGYILPTVFHVFRHTGAANGMLTEAQIKALV